VAQIAIIETPVKGESASDPPRLVWILRGQDRRLALGEFQAVSGFLDWFVQIRPRQNDDAMPR
jgi:hypothetical protein